MKKKLLACERKRTDMTPCVVTDGPVAYGYDSFGGRVCVGCGAGERITKVPVHTRPGN